MKAIQHRKISTPPVRQRGLSLVELMVAIALGLFLTWGAIQAFLSGKQTYSLQQAMSRIQENGRMAQELIGYDIRDAGVYGCATGKFVVNGIAANTLPNRANTEFDFQNVVFVANDVSGANTGDMALATPLNPPPLAGTDILVVRMSENLGIDVLGPLTMPPGAAPTAAQVSIVNRGLQATDVVVVSDCTKNQIFYPQAVTANTLSFAFGDPPIAGSTVMRLNTAIYYIANNAAGRPALYRRLLNGVSEELLEGVEDMQMEIGIDTNNNGQVDVFRTPDLVNAGQWSAWNDTGDAGLLDNGEQNVMAVRYSLLLRSNENLLDEPQTYNFNGVDVPAADRRLRQVFTSTVAIRSRLN